MTMEPFEAQVRRTPHAVAAVLDGESMTYDTLNRRANQVAHRLRRLGVGPEVIVGICMERSLEMLVGILGILKAGGAYVPLDPVYPQDRLAFMLADTQAPVLLTQSRLLDELPAHEADTICLDGDWAAFDAERDDNPVHTTSPDNLAYVIYTSGSTGQPKGVCVEHRAAVGHFATIQALWQLGARDRVLQFASFSFDASLEHIFPTLYSGATLVLRGAEGWSAMDFSRQARTVELTVADLPTAYWDQWVQESVTSMPQDVPHDLRLVVIGGEAVRAESIRRWQRSPLRSIRLVNAYGPTETTVSASLYEITPHLHEAAALDNVPIGRPLPNRTMHILDMDGAPVPVGASGELHIGGAGLARGYLHRPDLTAAKFIHDPFSPEPGARLYRTGDLARYRPDGEIEFLGRIDQQVKIRGFRIELGEIEERLSRHPDVQQAVVAACDDGPGGKRLVAYVVPRAHSALTGSHVRGFLQEALPDYMVPSAIVFLDALPITANGKIDRKALPAPGHVRPDLPQPYAPPRTAEEETLAEIWTQVLRVDRVGIHDHFLELGGESLLAMQVAARAIQAGLRITAEQFMRHPTIAELAAVARAAAPTMRAEQGSTTGPVPLTPTLRYYLADPHSHSQDGIEQVSLEARHAIDPALIEQALRRVIAHHDALRLRFSQGESEWQASCVGAEENAVFQSVDLTGLAEAAQQETVATTLADARAAIDLVEGPLLRLVLFKRGARKPDRLELLIHHVAFDAYSESILLQDLETAYRQLNSGREPRLPAGTTSFKHWAERLAEHARSTDVRQQVSHWLGMPWQRVTPLPLDYPEAAGTPGRVRSVKAVLSVDETNALLHDVPRASGAGVPDALSTALARALAEWTGSRSVLLGLVTHGREALFDDVDLSRTVGWFSSSCPILLDVDEMSRAGAMLPAVTQRLRRAGAESLEYDVLRYLMEDSSVSAQLQQLPQPEIDLNYLGQVDQMNAGLSLFVRCEPLAGPPTRQPVPTFHGLRLKARVQDGQLRLGLRYHENAYRRSTMRDIVEQAVETLREIIADCKGGDGAGVPEASHANGSGPTAHHACAYGKAAAAR